tara:strand:- start:580 stop:972 length:393 start_codon:yes stop_codon:yes gene_type:complete
MSAAIARKVALAYWGFAQKAAARAPHGVDLKVLGECGTSGLDEATAPLQRFAALVTQEWPEHIGTLGKYGRMGLPQLQQLAAQAQEDDTPVTPEQVETWARNLVDAEQKCFLAVSVHRSVRRLLLINIGV